MRLVISQRPPETNSSYTSAKATKAAVLITGECAGVVAQPFNAVMDHSALHADATAQVIQVRVSFDRQKVSCQIPKTV